MVEAGGSILGGAYSSILCDNLSALALTFQSCLA